jgi:hypothetical protein
MRDPDPTRQPATPESAVSAQQLASAARISVALLQVLVERGLVEPLRPDGSEFTLATAVRVRRMVRLRTDLGVSYLSAGIIVDLLERLDRLEPR